MEQLMELLAPAGSPEILKAVLDAGADAVYLGGDRFGARAYASNFSGEELLKALDYAHLRGKKIYLTVNTLMKNRELSGLREYLLPLYLNGLDAVLIQDMGALVQIRDWFPDLELHTSTQMTVTGAEGVRLLQQYGVSRVVMAREVSLAEMRQIHEETGMELEAFVHGALCYCYSGQCLFSSMLGGRSGNRGRCAQPCRLPYTVIGQDGKTQKEDSYILSLKDFCAVDALRQLRASGVYSLKIEGRMKQKSYAAGVTAMYRRYLDRALTEEVAKNFRVEEEDKKTLSSYGSRIGFTDGYLYKHNGSDMITYQKPSFTQSGEYVSDSAIYRRINGRLDIKKDVPIRLSVWDETHQVSVTSQVPDAAQRQPVTKEEVSKRIRKTKDTAFLFDELVVDLDDGLFVPNGVLNQLKRDALEQLKDKILQDFQRADAQDDTVFTPETVLAGRPFAGDCPASSDTKHIASTENRALLPFILESDRITHVYLDSTAYSRDTLPGQLSKDAASCHKAHKKAYFILPSICRADTMQYYEQIAGQLKVAGMDGFVVKNLESVWFVRKHFPSTPMICDHNLYTYNDKAVEAFLQMGAAGVTVPFELNKNELAGRKNTNSEIWVYGYYPLMTSAQCVCKNTEKCTHTPGVRFLVDRYKKRFAVKNCCSECYNVIYNSLPTMLFAQLNELRANGITGYRLHFSTESEKEVKKVLRLYESFLSGETQSLSDGEKMLYTNGHYKRGVE
jgi:putative protease